jgi:polyferredoxin
VQRWENAFMPYEYLADAVLLTHFAVVVFVVGGLAVVVVGNWVGWRWVNGWWFRLSHLIVIAIVVAQAWIGEICPLTKLESWLRVRAGEEGYTESFVSHWLHAILYYRAPFWIFILVYSFFAALVIAVWWRFPPTRHNSAHTHRG